MSSDIYTYFKSQDFCDNYNSYIHNNSKIISFHDFLNSINIHKLDTLKLSRENIHKPKIPNKNINSFLNKLSHDNFDKIANKIKLHISTQNISHSIAIDNILNYCLLQYSYCDLYIKLLNTLFENLQIDFNYHEYISNFITAYKFPEFNADIYENSKMLNNFLGFSCLIGNLEKYNITSNTDTEIIFNNIIQYYMNNNDNDIKYKYIQSVHMILKTLYGKNPLPDKYLTLFTGIINSENYPKIKYKIMDIIDRK